MIWHTICIYLYIPFPDQKQAEFRHYFIKIMIPEIIFTTVTTLIVYRFFLLYRKLKAWEKQGRQVFLFDDLKEFLKNNQKSGYLPSFRPFPQVIFIMCWGRQAFKLQIVEGRRVSGCLYSPG